MTNSFGKNSKLFWNMLGRVSKKKTKTSIIETGIQDENGVLVKNLDSIMLCAKKYFKNLGCAASLMSGNTFDESHKRKVEKEVENFYAMDTEEGTKAAEPVSIKDIKKALARLKNGKAATDIPNEILKAGGDPMAKVLKTLFDVVLA